MDSNNQTTSPIVANASNPNLNTKVHDFFKSGTFKQGFTGFSSTSSASNSLQVTDNQVVGDVIEPVPVENVELDEDTQLAVLDQALAEVEATHPVETPVIVPELVSSPTEAQANLPPVQLAGAQTTLATEPVQPDNDLQPEGLISQSLNQALTTQANNNLNPVQATSSAKETARPTQEQAAEANMGVQVVESEPATEISPEIESYLKRVDQQDSQPKEIIIADDISQVPDTSNYKAKPVIVLPITPEIEKQARFKSPQFSIKWLVEWSRKIMKVFTGKVIYRQVENSPKN